MHRGIFPVDCEAYQYYYQERREILTSARMQAVTPVPHEATTGRSKEMPAKIVRTSGKSSLIEN